MRTAIRRSPLIRSRKKSGFHSNTAEADYDNDVVGFWGDFVVYITTNSKVGTTRFGDYVTIRQDPTASLGGRFFDAFGYGLDQPGATTDAHYVVFGRPQCQGR